MVHQINHVTGQIVDGGMCVHTALGPGLLDSVCRSCLAHELHLRGFIVRTEVPVDIKYKGITLGPGYRIDLLVDEQVVVEVKAVSRTSPVAEAQLLSHVKLGRYRVGLLLNFYVRQFKHGITRVANLL
ncbi:MAG: GxxExxY protein [Gemmatimonadota bacterium]